MLLFFGVLVENHLFHKIQNGGIFLDKNNLYFGNRETCSLLFEIKLAIQTFVSRHFPKVLKEKIKKRLRRKGKVFYSDYEEEDIS